VFDVFTSALVSQNIGQLLWVVKVPDKLMPFFENESEEVFGSFFLM